MSGKIDANDSIIASKYSFANYLASIALTKCLTISRIMSRIPLLGLMINLSLYRNLV